MMPLRLSEVRKLPLNHFMPQVETVMNSAAGITKVKRMSMHQFFAPRSSLRGLRSTAIAPKNSVCISRLSAAARQNIISTQAIPEKICCQSQT